MLEIRLLSTMSVLPIHIVITKNEMFLVMYVVARSKTVRLTIIGILPYKTLKSVSLIEYDVENIVSTIRHIQKRNAERSLWIHG